MVSVCSWLLITLGGKLLTVQQAGRMHLRCCVVADMPVWHTWWQCWRACCGLWLVAVQSSPGNNSTPSIITVRVTTRRCPAVFNRESSRSPASVINAFNGSHSSSQPTLHQCQHLLPATMVAVAVHARADSSKSAPGVQLQLPTVAGKFRRPLFADIRTLCAPLRFQGSKSHSAAHCISVL